MADYSNYGLLVDYKYCSNCGSCVVACQEEKDLAAGESGIVIFEKGPWKKEGAALDAQWEWDYMPIPTDKCDFCAERLDVGKKPMCVKHCLSACMEIGPVDELSAKMAELGPKVALYKLS